MNGWRAVVRVLRSRTRTVFDDVVTTLFPADCMCCQGPLERASAVPVCEGCVGRVERNTAFGCGKCGEAINLDLDLEDARFAGMLAQGFLCRECRLAEPEFTRAVAYGSYDNEMRGLIHLLKFARVRGVARLMGRRMAEAVLLLEGEAANELLVIGVPLYRDRERQRGFNQAVLLADEALRWLKTMRPEWQAVASHRLLERHRHTESSYVLSPKGRRRNLRGAFRVRGDVSGREVLLIDDLFTSGATARECARVLMRAGATKVWVATLARAQKKFVMRQHEDPGELVARWDLAVEPG